MKTDSLFYELFRRWPALAAYSGPIGPLILIEIGHPFWFKPATDSG